MSTSDIRLITRDEIPECVNVIRESFMTVAREFGFTKEGSPRFTGHAINNDRLYYQFDIEKRPMFALCDCGRIVGYYSLSLPENGMCELNNLSVLPEFRHRGFGEKMVSDGLERMKSADCRRAMVCIVEENKRLRAWYESLGFKHIEAKKLDGFEFNCGYLIKEL